MSIKWRSYQSTFYKHLTVSNILLLDTLEGGLGVLVLLIRPEFGRVVDFWTTLYVDSSLCGLPEGTFTYPFPLGVVVGGVDGRTGTWGWDFRGTGTGTLSGFLRGNVSGLSCFSGRTRGLGFWGGEGFGPWGGFVLGLSGFPPDWVLVKGLGGLWRGSSSELVEHLFWWSSGSYKYNYYT